MPPPDAQHTLRLAAHRPAAVGVRLARVLVQAGLLFVVGNATAAELVVDEGVVIKFGPDAQMIVRDKLTVGPGIVLTSRRDDAVAGQTGSSAQTPAAGDWRGLRLERSAAAFGTPQWTQLSILYAGAADSDGGAGLTLRGINPVLAGLRIHDSLVGLRLLAGASPSVSGSSFLRNSTGVLAPDASLASFSGSQFTQSVQWGIQNLAPVSPLRATGNWWGSATGPRDPVGNPLGQGDAVSSGVDYASFLTSEPLLACAIRAAAPAPVFELREVQFELTCTNATEYRLSEDAGFAGAAFQPLPGGSAAASFTLSAGDGRKPIQAQFRNAVGSTALAVLSGGILYDVSPPALAVSGVDEGATVSEPVVILATASDGSGIARVELRVDEQLVASDSSEPYSLTWDPLTVSEGPHVLLIRAVDGAGRTTEATRNVTVSRADLSGPLVSQARLDGVALADGAVITRSGSITLNVSDRSGVARVELLIDGVVIAVATGTGPYTAALSLDAIAQGAHVLALKALDSLGNASLLSFNVVVARAAPEVPVISQPQTGLLTRTALLAVSGTAAPGASVQLLLGGQPAAAPVVASSQGVFNGTVTLVQGPNSLQATATDAFGTSAPSAPVTVTLDLTVPAGPGTLSAASLPLGQVRLTWARATDASTAGYHLYRSPAPFTEASQGQKVHPGLLTVTTFDDLPSTDGAWYYRLFAVNSNGILSTPSTQAQAVADSVLPRATSIAFTPLGKVDPLTGRIGQGQVNLVLTVSEPLQAPPYLAIVPPGGVPLAVTLQSAGANRYNGSFVVDATTPSGTANVQFSARDLVGNRGTDVDAGASLLIDTAGPALSGVVLTPASPIKNEGAPALQATFTFSKIPKTTPQVSYLLSGPLRTAVPLTLSNVEPTRWQASFVLPSDAGLAGPELLSFQHQSVDDLDNQSNKVTAPNQFQVYQGPLPPASVPFNFTAKALPGGKVGLAWQAVPDAALYQVYRQGPSEPTLVPLVRTTGTELVDQTPADGLYRYAVASVRQANGQESVSGQSIVQEVQALRSGPGAPQNFSLQLTGQGVQAQWLPPVASQVASYNLYRSSGTAITSIAGLVPLKTGITGTATLDTQPRSSESAYVVTALDAAGNESALSNSAYLNASLLPVANVRVDQIDAQLPELRWDAPNSGVAGYLVYVGPDAARSRLTPSPIGTLSFTDTGYSSGERRYTIASVDANGVEMPRVVLLPAVTADVVSGLPLQRGIMNRLQVQVSNASATALQGVRVMARVPTDAAGTQFKDHRSAVVDLGANQTLLVPVVVGGYAEMPSAAAGQLALEISPNEGELLRVVRSRSFDVRDGGLVVGMATDEFIRGGTGKLRLTVENTTEVEVELLTATDNGNTDSTELRLKLLDTDGNLLASQPFKQVIGPNIVTLLNGLSVARIPAGSLYTSDTFNLNVPGASPNAVRVRLEVDKLRYRSGQPDEVIITGRGSEKSVSLVDTAYVAEVTEVAPLTSFGEQDIVITGRALERQTGALLPNTRVKLVLNQQGFERSFIVITGGDGRFVYAFKPSVTDGGLFKVSAVHPDITDRPEQKSFTINRVAVTPTPIKVDVPRNYPFSVPFVAKGGPGAAATGLRFQLNAASQPTGQLPVGIDLRFPAPVNVAERQTVSVPVVFTASNDAQPSGSIVVDLYSAEGGSTAVAQARIDYRLSEAKPFLVATPSLVEAGIVQGTSQVESVSLQNNGLQEAVNLRFTLTRADGGAVPGWVAIASRADGSLPIGGKRSVDLSFTPPADTPPAVYEFILNVEGDNLPRQGVRVFASVTQTGQGNVLFKASDLFTLTPDKQGQLIQGLAGATVLLQNEDVPTISLEGVTDNVGEALFRDLPAGSYKFRVRAANHQEASGRLSIKPGLTVNQPVFLEYTLVTVEWSVREIAIEDRYEIVLSATFETDVPAPVVVLEPPSTNLPKMSPGEVFYGNLSLTNYGLVRADNLRQTLPASDPYFRYEFLAEPPTTLEAKQRVVIPYRIVALQSPDEAASGPNSSGGGGACYASGYRVDYSFDCANGVTSGGSTSANWFYSGSGSSSCPGINPTGPPVGPGNGFSPTGTTIGGAQRCVALPNKPCP